MKQFTVIVLLATLLLGCAAAPPLEAIAPQPQNVIFTTGLTADNEPVNDLRAISINEQRIILYVKWQLPRSEHIQATRILDGAGRLVLQREDRFIAPETSPTPSTWVWYDIDKNRDAPGNWTFEIYLNGEKVVEERLNVSA